MVVAICPIANRYGVDGGIQTLISAHSFGDINKEFAVAAHSIANVGNFEDRDEGRHRCCQLLSRRTQESHRMAIRRGLSGEALRGLSLVLLLEYEPSLPIANAFNR
jgi:hypothetical protein